MKLKTIQASAFKAVFEVLKDIINDVNVYFTDKGVSIVTLDTARVTLVQMNLAHDNFEEYECSAPVTAGLNMTNMYKLLKSVGGQDTLSIQITGRDYMNMEIENHAKKSVTKFSLKLLDINDDVFDLPENIKMDVITTMPSVDFQKISRDMGNLAKDMEIRRTPKTLEFSCAGDFAHQKTIIEYPDEINCNVGNSFSLKYINLFTKATGMCSSVQLMQDSTSDDKPIIFKYTIANLGDLKFYLAPNIDE